MSDAADHWEPLASPEQWWGVFHVESPEAEAIALLPSKARAERFIASMERDSDHDDFIANPDFCHALPVRFRAVRSRAATMLLVEYWNDYETPEDWKGKDQ